MINNSTKIATDYKSMIVQAGDLHVGMIIPALGTIKAVGFSGFDLETVELLFSEGSSKTYRVRNDVPVLVPVIEPEAFLDLLKINWVAEATEQMEDLLGTVRRRWLASPSYIGVVSGSQEVESIMIEVEVGTEGTKINISEPERPVDYRMIAKLDFPAPFAADDVAAKTVAELLFDLCIG